MIGRLGRSCRTAYGLKDGESIDERGRLFDQHLNSSLLVSPTTWETTATNLSSAR